MTLFLEILCSEFVVIFVGHFVKAIHNLCWIIVWSLSTLSIRKCLFTGYNFFRFLPVFQFPYFYGSLFLNSRYFCARFFVQKLLVPNIAWKLIWIEYTINITSIWTDQSLDFPDLYFSEHMVYRLLIYRFFGFRFLLIFVILFNKIHKPWYRKTDLPFFSLDFFPILFFLWFSEFCFFIVCLLMRTKMTTAWSHDEKKQIYLRSFWE